MTFPSQNLLPKSSDTEISSTFSKVVQERKRNIDDLYDKKKKNLKSKKKRMKKAKLLKSTRDTENYIPYHSSDKHTEDGLAINSFERQAQNAELSISTNTQEMNYKPGQKKWDRIKKKMVSVENPKAGKIRTESGIWIPATYKTGRYADWKEKTKTEDILHQEMGLEGMFLLLKTNFFGKKNFLISLFFIVFFFLFFRKKKKIKFRSSKT